MKTDSTSRALIVILSVALGLRFVFAFLCKAIPDFSDMGYYNTIALEHGFPRTLPPGYPLFLRGIYSIFGPRNYTAVYFVQGILSTLTVYLFYRVTRAVRNERAGLIAAGIAAVYPHFIAYNLTTMTETVSLFFLGLLLAVLVSGLGETRKALLATTIIFAAYLFKPVMLFFAPGAFFSLRKRLVFCLALAGLLGAWLLTVPASTGDGYRFAQTFYRAYNPDSDGQLYAELKNTEIGRDNPSSAAYLKEGLAFIRANKWKTVEILYNKASILVSRGYAGIVLNPVIANRRDLSAILTYAYLPVMALGVIGMIRLYERRNRALLFAALGYAILAVTVAVFKFRYRLPLVPILIIYAAMLIESAVSGRRAAGAPPALEPRRGFGDDIRKAWDILLVILFLAAALRVYAAFAAGPPPETKELETLNSLALEGGIGVDHAPLYPLGVRGLYALFGAFSYRPIYLLQGLVGAAVCLLMYLVAAALWSRRAGLIAATMSALYPGFIALGLTPSYEMLAVAIVLALAAANLSAIGDGSKALLSAALASIGVLLQPALVCLAPGIALATKRWRLFLAAFLSILLAYSVSRSAFSGFERRIVPVYRAEAYGFSLAGLKGSPGKLPLLTVPYENLTFIFGRRWAILDGDESPGADAASTNLTAYAYTLLLVVGLVGFVKHARREHWRALLPVAGYAVILVYLSTMRFDLRAPLLPVLVVYASILVAELKARRARPREGATPS